MCRIAVHTVVHTYSASLGSRATKVHVRSIATIVRVPANADASVTVANWIEPASENAEKERKACAKTYC